MSKAITREELRDKFVERVRAIATHWAENPQSGSIQDRCEGVAFSILVLLDGGHGFMPAFDVVARPHPGDKQYCIDNGEDWIEDGTCINNDDQLHELLYHKTE